jgi:hypothetical protein
MMKGPWPGMAVTVHLLSDLNTGNPKRIYVTYLFRHRWIRAYISSRPHEEGLTVTVALTAYRLWKLRCPKLLYSISADMVTRHKNNRPTWSANLHAKSHEKKPTNLLLFFVCLRVAKIFSLISISKKFTYSTTKTAFSIQNTAFSTRIPPTYFVFTCRVILQKKEICIRNHLWLTPVGANCYCVWSWGDVLFLFSLANGSGINWASSGD